MARLTLKKITMEIVKYSKIYEMELCNKNLLFAYDDLNIKFLEVAFYDYNFMHLVGAGHSEKKLFATEFYSKCINNTLSWKDVHIDEYGTTQLKIEALPLLLKKNLSAKMVCDVDTLHPKLFTEKISGNTSGFIGFVNSNNVYVPNTLFKADIRDYSSECKRVLYVLRKDINSDEYNEIVYVAKNIERPIVPFVYK